MYSYQFGWRRFSMPRYEITSGPDEVSTALAVLRSQPITFSITELGDRVLKGVTFRSVGDPSDGNYMISGLLGNKSGEAYSFTGRYCTHDSRGFVETDMAP